MDEAKLAAIETKISNGSKVHAACKEEGISDVTFYTWRKRARPQEVLQEAQNELKSRPKRNRSSASPVKEKEIEALRRENQRLKDWIINNNNILNGGET